MIFTRRGNSYFLSDPRSTEQFKTLPVGNYTVKHNPMTGYFLERVDSFPVPSKIYGSVEKTVSRILSTYESRDLSTGVLLSGEKGSGKSLTAKLVSIRAAERGIPTIVVNTAWHGEDFNEFLQQIDQLCVVLFDEFEKVYNSEQQQALLTLLDGTFPQKKLYVITCNDKYRIDSHMSNRPGRIFYSLDYTGLDADFIEDYCNDVLEDKEQTQQVVRISTLFEQFNFDMLKALVEEMNRYGETPLEAIKFLNAKPETASRNSFKVNLTIDGQPPKGTVDDTVYVNPLRSQSFDIDVTVDDDTIDSHTFGVGDLKHINGNTGEYVYIKGGMKLVLTRSKEETFSLHRHSELLTNGYTEVG